MTLRFRKEQVFIILLLCFSISASLMLAESVLRFLLPNSFFIWPPHLQSTFNPDQSIMPGVLGQARFVTNSLGLRGDELSPTHTYRVLAIGGSTTECSYLDQFETWTYHVQKTLNENSLNHHVWVGNGGKSGQTTRHHLTAMQYLPLLEMKIDAILLLIGGNDFVRRLARHENYDPDFLAKPESKENLIRSTFSEESYINPSDRFPKNTVIWRMMRKIKRQILQNLSLHNVNDHRGESYVKWRNHRQQAAEIRDELPDLSSAHEEFARNIHKMIDIAQNKSIRLILMTQPSLWRSDLSNELDALLWFGGIGDYQKEPGHIYYSPKALEQGMQSYNNILLKICHERQVECVDLAPMLEKDTSIFYDDMHYNESGAEAVSKTISNYLLSHEPLREAT